MELKRWKFSKQVKPELEEFLNCVKNNKRKTDTKKEKIWQILLPQMPLSFYELESTTIESSDEEIITIDEDAPISIPTNAHTSENLPEISVNNLTFAKTTDILNESDFQDVHHIKEYLNSNTVLQSEDLKKLCAELNPDVIKRYFKILSENVSDNGLSKLGESFYVNSVPANELVRQYCCLILFNKLINPDTYEIFTRIIPSFVKMYPEIIRQEILLQFLKADHQRDSIFQTILNLLEQTNREKLVRDFAFSCCELESFQLKLLQPLICSITEHSVKRRIINLMSISADKFKTDKLFIKILIELIRNLGKGFIDQESILYEIIDKNKTLSKITAQKALDEWFNNYNDN